MKPTNTIFLIFLGLLTSCYKVYEPKIDTGKKVLVVNGMITNKVEVYHITLSYTEPFNSSRAADPATGADVTVTDDLGNRYLFKEGSSGNYTSDTSQFTAIPGRSYRLHILTPDLLEYESDPQKLFPEVHPDSVYSEFDSKKTLDKNTGLVVLTHGANILADIRNQSDTLPRFRLASNLVTQYFYTICPIMAPCDFFYCWKTTNANSNINLTGGIYSESSASIRKHLICFLDDNLFCYALYYYYSGATSYYQFFMIHHRIIYLKLYTLNIESFLYYKSLDKQLQSEGKLFDPIAAQLNGNIKCITNPETKAIGFFEASSVSYSAYTVDFRNLTSFQPSIIRIPYILPPETNGCRINNIPPFWINK
ncbi:MAG: DUF4249 domain-containing protein [Bacteroidota bacterium]